MSLRVVGFQAPVCPRISGGSCQKCRVLGTQRDSHSHGGQGVGRVKRRGPFSQYPRWFRCRPSLGRAVGKPVLGGKPFCRKAQSPGNWRPLPVGTGGRWPRLLLVSSFMSFSNWEAKQVPPSDGGLCWRSEGTPVSPQGEGVGGQNKVAP